MEVLAPSEINRAGWGARPEERRAWLQRRSRHSLRRRGTLMRDKGLVSPFQGAASWRRSLRSALHWAGMFCPYGASDRVRGRESQPSAEELPSSTH